MEEIVIKRTVSVYILLLVCSLAFVAGGVFILLMTSWAWVGMMGIIFFGGASLVFTWQILDARPRLIINNEGILDRTLGVGVIRWSDIESAYKRSIQGNDFVCLQLRNTDEYVQRLSPLMRVTVRANTALGFTPLSINLSGIEGMTEQVLGLILKKSQQ